MLKLGILISGSGSNLQAIIDAIQVGTLEASIEVVISNKGDAYGLNRARMAGIQAIHIDQAALKQAAELEGSAELTSSEAVRLYNQAVRDCLIEHNVDYVVMAGYMRLLGKEVLDAFPLRVLNLHPALLPSFPGAHGIADALAYGVKVTGITVHFADEEFDRGPIIAQMAVEVREDDTEDTLAERIHKVEHELYPHVLSLIAQDRVVVEGRRVRVLPV